MSAPSMRPTMSGVAERYAEHNRLVRLAQAGQPAPAPTPGATVATKPCGCGNTKCHRYAYPWDKLSRECEEERRRALRKANERTSRPVVPISPYAFEQVVASSRGGAR